MILCICLSPALDVTYRLAELVPGAANRVSAVQTRPGGKAVNVARLLDQLGEPVRVLLPLGGRTGDVVAQALGPIAVPIPSGAQTRRTTAVVEDDGRTTLLNEPSVIDCWPELLRRSTIEIESADVVVVSGSVPAGVPDDGVAALVRLARDAGRPVIVDTSGPALALAVAAGPTMIKPNADELGELMALAAAGPGGGPGLAGGSDPELAARAVASTSGVTVVASLGEAGLIAVDGDAVHRVRPVQRLTGNPTGAGDAVVAGLARSLRAGTSMPDTLADCLALSAAAVLSPVAGEISLPEYHQQQEAIRKLSTPVDD